MMMIYALVLCLMKINVLLNMTKSNMLLIIDLSKREQGKQ